MATLALRVFWSNPDHPALNYGTVTKILRRPGATTFFKNLPGDAKKDPQFSMLPVVRVYLGKPLGAFEPDGSDNFSRPLLPAEVNPKIGLGRQLTYELGDAELARMAPRGTFELGADFSLELEAANQAAKKIVGAERLRCRTLSLRQTWAIQEEKLVAVKHTRGASPAMDFPGLHPQLEWKVDSEATHSLEIITEFLDVTPLFERFAAIKGTDADEKTREAIDRASEREGKFRALVEDAKTWGYSIRYLMSTVDAKKQWIWAAVVPDALGSGLNEPGRIACWMHYQAFPDYSYSNVSEIFDFEVFHRIRTPDDIALTEKLRGQRWRAPVFLYSAGVKPDKVQRRVWQNLETHVEASCGRLLADAGSPWIMFWPFPDLLSAKNPDFGPARQANLRRAMRRGLRALQAQGLVHPNPGVADVRRVALSAHSGGVKGLQFAVKTNPARDLDAVWLMDVSRFNYALPPDPTNEDKDKRWASLWSWAASAERKYSLVTWGYSFTKGDAKALSATLKGEMQPADDAFWNLGRRRPRARSNPPVASERAASRGGRRSARTCSRKTSSRSTRSTDW